jgi:hypothetical protein
MAVIYGEYKGRAKEKKERIVFKKRGVLDNGAESE